MSFTKDWAKYKRSGTYRRAVKKNVERIRSDSEVSQVVSKEISIGVSNEPGDHVSRNFVPDNPPQNGDNFNVAGECRINDNNPWNFQLAFEGKEFDDIEKNRNVHSEMKKWAINNNISHVALKEVLQIWNNRFPNILPSDPRTLLNTPAKIEIHDMASGKYWHCGLVSCLKIIFQDISEPVSISLNVNIDGLPLFKSTKDEFWPILFNISEMPNVKPMVIGIYHGKGKPDNMPLFLELFVNELKQLINDGFIFNGHKISVKIRSFICDSPARAFIKGVANFNGQHGCLKCETVGEYSYDTNCNIFPRTHCTPRTDAGFREKIYEGHHKTDSPLLQLPLDMIKDFPTSDRLHLIDGGHTKRLLVGWKDGSFKNSGLKLSAREIAQISFTLEQIKMPKEIHRSVRGLDCVHHWKGTEFYTFLHYISIVVIKDFLPTDVYEHFLLYFCSVTIFSTEKFMQYIDCAEAMLNHYLELFRHVYGEQYMTSNVHNLVHLVDDVKRYGSLSTFSSYPFENMLGHIKALLIRRGNNNVLASVAKRIIEIHGIQKDINNKNERKTYPKLSKKCDVINLEPHHLLNDKLKYEFYSKIEFENFVLSSNDTNKWFLTVNNEIVAFKYVVCGSDHRLNIWGVSLKNLCDFFKDPITSTTLNIYSSDICSTNTNTPQLYRVNDIKCKLVSINYKHLAVFFPLLHTL